MSRTLKMRPLQKIVKSIKRKLKIPIIELIFDSRIFLIPYLISSIFYNNFKLHDHIFLKEEKKKEKKEEVQIHMQFQGQNWHLPFSGKINSILLHFPN